MEFDIVNQNLAIANQEKLKIKASSMAGGQSKEKDQKDLELKEACAGFEAIFMNAMIKSMRETLPGDALFNESHGANIYKSMYDQHLAENLSKSRNSLGIKDFLYQELKESE